MPQKLKVKVDAYLGRDLLEDIVDVAFQYSATQPFSAAIKHDEHGGFAVGLVGRVALNDRRSVFDSRLLEVGLAELLPEGTHHLIRGKGVALRRRVDAKRELLAAALGLQGEKSVGQHASLLGNPANHVCAVNHSLWRSHGLKPHVLLNVV